MDAILIKSRYKISHVLHVERDYAACLAVDIESREMTEYLLNIYENELKREYIGYFASLRRCPEFVSVFIAEDALVAVFKAVEATGIDSMFYKGADLGWEERLAYAQLVMHLALSVSVLPHAIGCAALLSRNLRVNRGVGGIQVNYVVSPLGEMNARELVFLLGDQIGKILIGRYSSADAELEFVRRLKSGSFTTVPPLYSHWLEAKKEITGQYERIYAKNALSRTLYMVYINLRRGLRKLLHSKGKGAKA